MASCSPPRVLPRWLQGLSELIPLTHALEAMRHALLQGAGLSDVAVPLAKLAVFAIVLPVAGFTTFSWATNLAKRYGSLTEF